MPPHNTEYADTDVNPVPPEFTLIGVEADTVVNLHHKVDSLAKVSDSLQHAITTSPLSHNFTGPECLLGIVGCIAVVFIIKFFFDFLNA